MSDLAWLAALLGGTAVGLLWLSRWTAARLIAELGADAVERVDRSANFFGLESAGVTQTRGNGCLVLTTDAVVFQMWLPRTRVRIARERIRKVEVRRSHLTKRSSRDLLWLSFASDSGANDAVAFAVREVGPWVTALRPAPE